MSLTAARVQPRTDPRPARTRWLRAVTAPAARRRPKLAGAVLAVGGALAIGAAQMGISLASTQDAFVLADLNSQQHELNLQKQALDDELVGLNSPQALASKAADLGLVVAGAASYLRLSDGAVLGAGHGADWISTVDPNGATKVGNSLIAPPVTPAQDTPAADATAQTAEPALPPAITDGLPSPTTR
ncbi:hypothetical protein QF046_000092 [Microbacterium sp. W4I4]|uniref:hypothetical protein n=1 Tax=Microbacterium sp. W4I4 TaxID=3042295 RepID=UPI00278AB909|nr:hypothetical protein [Microbacterium sp. W4I4]MDQ0612451.1 hypothetical protein [Microbacterium sp. W4I4]